MRMQILLATALIVPTLSACATTGYGDRAGYNNNRGDRYSDNRRDERRAERRARYLAENDVIYRDNDGRYYCKRDDGTAGTIVGAIAGGVLGNIIAPGGSKTLGTVLGAAGGALAGNAIDKSDGPRCE